MPPQIVTITDAATGASAQILVSLGFNCFSWRPALGDVPRDMLWAAPNFASGDERPSGSGIPLLFPFPGRIGGAQLRFEGRTYQLEAGDGLGNGLHGFVIDRPWRVVDQRDDRVVGEFQASVDDPSVLDRWPSDFRIRVSYEVRGTELLSDVEYENTGDGPLPCGFGTHAYFRLPLADGSAAEETRVTVPATNVWEADKMLPTGQQRPAATGSELDLASGGPLAGREFDTYFYFTDLTTGADRLVRTQLADPVSGRTVTQTFDPVFTQCIVYTPPHREAICLEPYTCVPDAVRLSDDGHETGLQILQPGERFATTLKIEVGSR